MQRAGKTNIICSEFKVFFCKMSVKIAERNSVEINKIETRMELAFELLNIDCKNYGKIPKNHFTN